MQREAVSQSSLHHQLEETKKRLEERNQQLELINQIGIMLTSELELDKLVQKVTDIATQISKAQFGALFYKKVNEQGEEHTLYTLSGADKKDFTGMHTLRDTPLLAPTFNGEGIIRSDDITQDPRYGQNKPHNGMPKGHLPLKSYLAVPVISKNGTVLGGLFFGHRLPGIFTQYEEDLVQGIAAQAAIAMDNARLFQSNLEAEQRTKLVLESIPLLAWTALPNGLINYFNKRWYEYSGLPQEPISGQEWQSIVHPDDLISTGTIWQQSMATGETFELDMRLRRASDNSYRWHLTRATVVKDPAGKILMWVGTCTDVDEVKQAQQSLLKKNEELVRINQDLDNFVYTASHDLKTPVIHIQQLIEVLHEGAQFQTEDAELLQELLNKSLKQLQHTIQDLSEIVKVQKDQETTIENLEIAPLIEEVKISLQVALFETGGSIITHLDQAPVLAFNRVNLKSILYNLISNGLKYRSPKRTPEITVTSSLVPGFLKISVSDNGLGIDLAQRGHKLFQMFSRFHDHVPGSGIGLYIVNRIIKNNGGYIEVDSQLDVGTTFNLYFKRNA
ncbi:PAS domain-containing protein [Adhaeribacter swui]|uniref:histidine kinase n=1 Tax=Adhaeribacter swui TaxID=2086471 RepID=A0A7G7GCF4_9BACT|nr:ATP-binding protein [Adhaeribacter swui]QNF34838.1 PAS domain-containing protein [Adhaeribacter swui]